MKQLLSQAIVALTLTLGSVAANAYTECLVSPSATYSGDDGTVYVFFTNGGSARIQSTDNDFKQSVAMIMTAIVTDRSLRVRYAADNVPCTDNFVWMVGLWLYK